MSGADGPLGFDDEAEERHAPAPEAVRAPRPAPRTPPARSGPLGLRRPGPGGWVLGVAVIVILGLILLNTLRTSGPGSKGLVRGDVAPAFAAPLAGSRLAASSRNDVNVATRAGQGSAGAVPACAVRRPDVVTSCALWDRGPAVIAFFATRGSACVRELDTLDDVARRHPGVRVLGVSVRGKLSAVRKLARRWSYPVAYDHDGVLANLYAVAVCPQLTFVARGGRAQGSALGAAGEADLERRFRALDG